MSFLARVARHNSEFAFTRASTIHAIRRSDSAYSRKKEPQLICKCKIHYGSVFLIFNSNRTATRRTLLQPRVDIGYKSLRLICLRLKLLTVT